MKAAVIAVLVVLIGAFIFGGWSAVAGLGYLVINLLADKGNINIVADGRGP